MINSGVVSIDDGGSSTCVVTKRGKELFPSVKGKFGNRTLTEVSGKYDYIVEYKGDKYVMGTLAEDDCKYPIKMHTDSKQHLFFDLSILVAIHQFGYSFNYLVTSVPITMHTEEEKSGRIKRLLGDHRITVNGKTKSFNIADIKVAPETAIAFWIKQPVGKTRFIDLGSRTIGFATTIFKDGKTRFVDTESGTFKGKGLEAGDGNYDREGLSDYICGRLSSIWKPDDSVHILGGGANDSELVEQIKKYFPKAQILESPQMANANGMYNLGRIAYDMD